MAGAAAPKYFLSVVVIEGTRLAVGERSPRRRRRETRRPDFIVLPSHDVVHIHARRRGACLAVDAARRGAACPAVDGRSGGGGRRSRVRRRGADARSTVTRGP